jgi:hypothetical protein
MVYLSHCLRTADLTRLVMYLARRILISNMLLLIDIMPIHRYQSDLP